MRNKSLGFGYKVSLEKIRQYRKMPVEKRLMWLYQGNMLRMFYPKRVVELQDKFREGKI